MGKPDPEALKPLLRDIGQGPTQGRNLTREEARDAMETILSGRATPAQAGGFLLLRRYKGETPGELLGFTDAVRARARRYSCPAVCVCCAPSMISRARSSSTWPRFSSSSASACTATQFSGRFISSSVWLHIRFR
jgi:hypothetical protein